MNLGGVEMKIAEDQMEAYILPGCVCFSLLTYVCFLAVAAIRNESFQCSWLLLVRPLSLQSPQLTAKRWLIIQKTCLQKHVRGHFTPCEYVTIS